MKDAVTLCEYFSWLEKEVSTRFTLEMDCIGGVMVNMLASSPVDRGFEPRSGQTKDYKIDICCRQH